jgi:hypothetical protein
MSSLFPVDELVNDIKVSVEYRINQFLRNYELEEHRYKEQQKIIESFPSVRNLRDEISALQTKLRHSENDKKMLNESLSQSQSVSLGRSPKHTQDEDDDDEVSKLTKERNIVRGKLYLMEQENKTLRMQLEAERLKNERKQAIERQRQYEIESNMDSESDKEQGVELTMASQVSGFPSEVVVTKKDDTKEVVNKDNQSDNQENFLPENDESEPKVHLDIQELDDLKDSDAEPVSEDDDYITDEADVEDDAGDEADAEDDDEDQQENEVEADAKADNEVEVEETETHKNKEEQNSTQEESEEEEMYETEIQGKSYITNDPEEQNGVIYDCVVDSDGDFGVGEEVGQFVNGNAEFFHEH